MIAAPSGSGRRRRTTVSLLTWPAGSAADAPASAATRTALQAQPDGSWTGRPAGSASGRPLPVRGDGLPAADPEDRDQPGHRPVRGRADPGLDPLGGGRPRRPGVPAGGRGATTASPKLARAVDSTIYELHVRDFSIGDTTVPADHRGSYLAFADRQGAGWQHLRTLAQAGLNTVHLLPTFDIASIPEDPANQKTPGLRPRFLCPRQRAAAGLRDGGRRRGRLQLGLRPVALDGAGGLLRVLGGQGRRRRPGGRVPHHGRRAARRRACGWCSTRSTTTPRPRGTRRPRCSTRWCPATTSGSTPTAR